MIRTLPNNTPGLFASPTQVREAQSAIVRYSNQHITDAPNAELERARIIADEREVRLHALVRSAVLWGVLGIPAVMTLLAMLALWVARSLVPASPPSPF